MGSLNFELDKYLEKRKNNFTSPSNFNKINKIKLNFVNSKFSIKKKNTEIFTAKPMKEDYYPEKTEKKAEKFSISFGPKSDAKIVERTSLFSKFNKFISEKFLSKEISDVDVPVEDDDVEVDENGNFKRSSNENFFNKPSFSRQDKRDLIEIEEEPDNLVDNFIDTFSRRDRIENETFSENELKSELFNHSNGNRTGNKNDDTSINHKKIVLYKSELNDDLKQVLKAVHKLVKMAPKPAIENFKRTPEYQKYAALLIRYGAVETNKKQ